MKNGMFKTSLLAGAVAFSGLAIANPSATLAVKGEVSTGTCTAVLPKANIDVGNISADSLPQTGSLKVIATEFYKLQITCTSPLKYQVSLIDNRADSAIPAAETKEGETFAGRVLGMGKTKENVNIGGYYVTLQNITTQIDGTHSEDMLYRSGEPGSSWTHWTKTSPGLTLSPLNNTLGITDRAYIAMASTGSLEPEASTVSEITFTTTGYVSSNLRSISDQETIDGSVTFNVDYL